MTRVPVRYLVASGCRGELAVYLKTRLIRITTETVC